ncbi:MAG: DUF5060 domain-containing protein [Bacteroidota bacterium]
MRSVVLVLAFLLASSTAVVASPEVTGTLAVWHRVTLTFDGPETAEDAAVNPFSDYRLTVTFTNEGRRYVVPGFFAADGDAGETSVASGTKWRVHFAPDAPGTWTYTASFRQGPDLALSLDPFEGTPTAFDGETGTMEIMPSDKTGRDFRAKGRLMYTGERYLRHAATQEAFIKGGPGSPEDLLGYHDFDGTFDNGGGDQPLEDGLHRYAPHLDDWNEGDPTWQGGRGKALIGGLNYIAEKGMNTIYFLLMNWKGDGDNVWPWTAPDEQDRFDVSKLDQWEIAFSHMDSLGIATNMLFQETENDTLFDGGRLGRLRKLYFREMVARFGHHLAVTWNLGEENNNTTAQHRAFTAYIKALDPYQHPVVIHNHVHLIHETLNPLLGWTPFNGVSFQVANPADVHFRVMQYLDASRAAGHQWVVNVDEIGHYSLGLTPDGPDSNADQLRRDVLWGTLMAGGAGVEWYFGYFYPNADLNMEDWRSRDQGWTMTKVALDFFREHLPYDRMHHNDGLTFAAGDYILADIGNVYAIYLPNGGSPELEMKDFKAPFRVRWFNPRTGGPLQDGSMASVMGGSSLVPLGDPPSDPSEDWVVLVTRE